MPRNERNLCAIEREINRRFDRRISMSTCTAWCSTGCIGAPRVNPSSMRRAPPSGAELAGLLDQIVARLMKMLTRAGQLVDEQGMTYLADIDADIPLAPLQAASCTYRIALGARAGQKVLSLRTGDSRDEKITHGLCADAHGLSLHAAARIDASNSNSCAATSPAPRSSTNA